MYCPSTLLCEANILMPDCMVIVGDRLLYLEQEGKYNSIKEFRHNNVELLYKTKEAVSAIYYYHDTILLQTNYGLCYIRHNILYPIEPRYKNHQVTIADNIVFYNTYLAEMSILLPNKFTITPHIEDVAAFRKFCKIIFFDDGRMLVISKGSMSTHCTHSCQILSSWQSGCTTITSTWCIESSIVRIDSLDNIIVADDNKLIIYNTQGQKLDTFYVQSTIKDFVIDPYHQRFMYYTVTNVLINTYKTLQSINTPYRPYQPIYHNYYIKHHQRIITCLILKQYGGLCALLPNELWYIIFGYL